MNTRGFLAHRELHDVDQTLQGSTVYSRLPVAASTTLVTFTSTSINIASLEHYHSCRVWRFRWVRTDGRDGRNKNLDYAVQRFL